MGKSSFVERNKAIREAWNREQALVQKGKGTREWTPKQQKDIIEKGRAYDENGRAFEGQHMRSAEKYPEYQADPQNIQFLTRTEHLEAHDGNWQNPTNWYFNLHTKEKIDFNDGPIIACKIIKLKEPIVLISKGVTKHQKQDIKNNITVDKEEYSILHNTKADTQMHEKSHFSTVNKVKVQKKTNNTFISYIKSTGRFIIKHPFESLEIVGVIIGSTVKVISNIKGKSSSGLHKDATCTSSSNSTAINIGEKINKASPSEHVVRSHSQHYLKNGKRVLLNKNSYNRGGNKEK